MTNRNSRRRRNGSRKPFNYQETDDEKTEIRNTERNLVRSRFLSNLDPLWYIGAAFITIAAAIFGFDLQGTISSTAFIVVPITLVFLGLLSLIVGGYLMTGIDNNEEAQGDIKHKIFPSILILGSLFFIVFMFLAVNGNENQSGFLTSTLNSSTDTLSAGEEFVGTAEDLSGYGGISIFAYSDVASANNGLRFETSTDGINWDSSLPVNLEASTREIHTLAVIAKYFRVRYLNGAAPQSEFRLQTTYYPTDEKLTSRMSQVISNDYDVQLVRAASDPFLDRAQNLFSNQTSIHKFGANPVVTASSTEIINFTGSQNWLTSADTIRIAAGGHANDTVAGTGTRTVVVEGLDANFDSQTATINTNGTLVSSSTTETFIRVFRAYADDNGTYGGKNQGNIVIESTGGTTLVTIPANAGQTLTSTYTIPSGFTGYLTEYHVNADTAKASDIIMYQRQNADTVAAPFTSTRVVAEVLQITGPYFEEFDSYISFPAKTDLWWEVTTGSGGNSSASATYDIILVEN